MANISNAELKLKQAALAVLTQARLSIIEGNYGAAVKQLETVTDSLGIAGEYKAERIRVTKETAKNNSV